VAILNPQNVRFALGFKHGIIIIFRNIFNGFLDFYNVTNVGAGLPMVPHDWVDPVRKS